MNLSVKEKQDLLALMIWRKSFRDASLYEYWVAKTQKRYQSKVRFDLDQQQRDIFFNNKWKIQEELGGSTQEENRWNVS
jgi:ATP-dependent Lon protease